MTPSDEARLRKDVLALVERVAARVEEERARARLRPPPVRFPRDYDLGFEHGLIIGRKLGETT